MKLGHLLDWFFALPNHAIAGWLFCLLVVAALAIVFVYRTRDMD